MPRDHHCHPIVCTVGFRGSHDDEFAGLDVTLHAESEYDLAGVAGGGILGGVHSLRERRPDLKEEQ